MAEWARVLLLAGVLAREEEGGADPVGKNSGPFPVVNLSVKISALYSQMNPADPTHAIAHLAPKLRPILGRARELGAFLNFDIDSYAHKNITLQLLKTTLCEGAFNAWPYAVTAIEASLPDPE